MGMDKFPYSVFVFMEAICFFAGISLMFYTDAGN